MPASVVAALALFGVGLRIGLPEPDHDENHAASCRKSHIEQGHIKQGRVRPPRWPIERRSTPIWLHPLSWARLNPHSVSWSTGAIMGRHPRRSEGEQFDLLRLPGGASPHQQSALDNSHNLKL
jgi:hypothetical protein